MPDKEWHAKLICKNANNTETCVWFYCIRKCMHPDLARRVTIIVPMLIGSGGATGEGGGGLWFFFFFFFFCLSGQRSVMAMIVPLPHYEICFENRRIKCVGATFSWLAQNVMARAAVARHFGNFAPPPLFSKHPGAAPAYRRSFPKHLCRVGEWKMISKT